MPFTKIIKELDNIEMDNKKNAIKELSKVVVSSNNINDLYGDLLFYQISKGDCLFCNRILIDNEIQLFNSNGDLISLFFDSKKQINMIVYKSFDDSVKLSLKKENDSVKIVRTINYSDNSKYLTKSIFKKENDDYVEKKFVKKYVEVEDELETSYKSTYEFKDDSLSLSESLTVQEKDQVLSTTSMVKKLDSSDYVKEDGVFHIIKPGKSMNDVTRVMSYSKKLVKGIKLS